jgi:oxygen-independent coproporphyrinogen-3 oxidase
MGAHSHRRGKRSWNTASLFDYLKRMKNNGKPIEGSELLGKRERFSEALLFGLRMNRGIDLVSLARRFNVDLKMAQVQQIERFITHGFFVRNRNVLRATPKGRLVLDELSAYLI